MGRCPNFIIQEPKIPYNLISCHFCAIFPHSYVQRRLTMSWINDAKKEASEKDSEIEAELIQILGSTLTEIEQVLLYAQDQGLILKPFKLVHSYVNTHIGNEGDFNSG